MDIRTYLRDEILEEGEQGILSADEVEERLTRFEAAGRARGTTAQTPAVPGEPASAAETSVPEDDSPIKVRLGQTAAGPRDISYYVAYPDGQAKSAGILVIHENRGLTAHIRDVARRLGALGYVALAPDLLTPLGGTPSFAGPGDAIAALGSREAAEMESDLSAALSQLAADPAVDADRLGVIGFCFGGGMAWRLLTLDSRLKAGVPFYGVHPPLSRVPRISAPVLGIYGGLDARINAGLPDIEKAMSESGKVFEALIFDGAQHAFHNDTNLDRYHPEAAAAAWEAATAWLDRYLGTPAVER